MLQLKSVYSFPSVATHTLQNYSWNNEQIEQLTLETIGHIISQTLRLIATEQNERQNCCQLYVSSEIYPAAKYVAKKDMFSLFIIIIS